MVLQLYDFPSSSNCHKVRLILSFLGLPYQTIQIDIKSRENRQASFLEINPFGQVPVLVDGDLVLRDSLAIMVYLVRKYAKPGQEYWLPDEPAGLAKTLSWATVASHELQNIAQLRRHYLFGESIYSTTIEDQIHQVLTIMDQHLCSRQWLVDQHPTIADIACFPYIGLAPEAKITLVRYQNLCRWLRNFQSLQGYINMDGIPTY